MNKLFTPGDILYGYCNGFFGRDDYDDKVCIFVNDRFVVFQYLSGEYQGNGVVLNYDDILNEKIVNSWKIDPYKDI